MSYTKSSKICLKIVKRAKCSFIKSSDLNILMLHKNISNQVGTGGILAQFFALIAGVDTDSHTTHS